MESIPSRAAQKTVMIMARPLWMCALIALGVVLAPAARASVESPLTVSILAIAPGSSAVHTHAAAASTAATHNRSRHRGTKPSAHMHSHARARHNSEYRAARHSTYARSATSPLPTGSTPRSSHPRHGHRSATVPHVEHRVGTPRPAKAGSSTAGAVSQGSLLGVDVRPLERSQRSFYPESREHPVVSGRGPPRASPLGTLSSLPPNSLPAPVASRRPSFASPPSSNRTHLPGSRISAAGADFVALVPQPRLSMGRLHVRRVEGPVACNALPSRGGFTCFA
jgi:hypothetical protein